MSYDNSKSTPSNGSRGRVGGAEEEKTAGPRSRDVSDAAIREEVSTACESRGPQSDDTDALSSGNDSAEQESEGGREGDKGRSRQSTHSSQSSSSHNGKDSGVMEMMESNKSSNSQSPSPPSSSLAYSVLSGRSERDPPSTSGCSSDASARVRTQKELMKALKELKIRLPADSQGKRRSSTLDALKYALDCVKQVRANQEYYHQWRVEECQGCSLDLSSFTVEELDNITSEYTLKNTDTFSMAVSFLSGKVVYMSPQGAILLRCKPEHLQGALFSELLAPQDVSTFYSGTAPCRLPVWASCMGSVSPPMDCTKEKSMFCRIGAERPLGGNVQYYPFRLTPYQLTLRDSDMVEPQPCCLLIAERVHSGYEAPRIPPDKRVFTTSHSPSCLFQEVDERAVALLGYLPQDLVGTPMLLYLHPEDRPIMVAIHKKILQFAGKPFDHSPLRMCARSGEYLTLDTSWSSYVNPWSRKVTFIVGRHKVRTSPLNEDVFTPPRGCEGQVALADVARLSVQIQRVLMQPVHGGGSQGYSSSHEQHLSAASSSDSNEPALENGPPAHKPMTFQQMCKDVHTVKANGQQMFIESRNRPPPRRHPPTAGTGNVRAVGEVKAIKGTTPEGMGDPKLTALSQLGQQDPSNPYSYQQINSLDSIIRYLESCTVPNPAKRKCVSSLTTSSTSEEDRKQDTNKGLAVALGGAPPLPPLPEHSKADSVVSATSQCSFSSTIVHVGDKKPPESDIVMEDASPPIAPTPPVAPLGPTAPPEKEARRGGAGRLGLTKEVLSAHTQQEEQAFLCRFRDPASSLRFLDPTSSLRCNGPAPLPRGVRSRDYPAAGSSSRRRSRAAKRLKHQEKSEQCSSVGPLKVGERLAECLPNSMPLAPPTTSSSWPTSVGSHASLPLAPYPTGVMPLYSIFPPMDHAGANSSQQTGIHFPLQNPPMAPPMMALVLPNYMFPQMNSSMAQMVSPINQINSSMAQMVSPMNQLNPSMAQMIAPINQLNPPMAQMVSPMNQMVSPMNQMNPPMAQMVSPMNQMNPTIPVVPQHFYSNAPGFSYPSPVPVHISPPHAQSRCSTPQSCCQPLAERERAESPLFQSRCSSPLNLLQLEELPGNRLEVATAQRATTPVGGVTQDWKPKQGGGAGGQTSTNQGSAGDSKDNEIGEANESNQDAMSTSSDLLDLLLQEDSRSGTGSAASGSRTSGTGSSGSGSNGCSSSGSLTRSSQSSNTSKYFGSVDSSENDNSRKQPAGCDGEEQFIKCVLQDPIWLLMANADEKVMMTYQLPVRDMEAVLRADRLALSAMQKQQPRFTDEQKRELAQVHPWIRTGRLPRSINISACVGCKPCPSLPATAPFDMEHHEMELCSVLESPEEGATREKRALPDTAMEEGEGGRRGERAQGKQQDNDQEMATEEQEVTSATLEEKAGPVVTDMSH